MKNKVYYGTIWTLAAIVTSSSLGQILTNRAGSRAVSPFFNITNGPVGQPLQAAVTNDHRATYAAITNAASKQKQAVANVPKCFPQPAPPTHLRIVTVQQ